jgi:hypothetical protein
VCGISFDESPFSTVDEWIESQPTPQSHRLHSLQAQFAALLRFTALERRLDSLIAYVKLIRFM